MAVVPGPCTDVAGSQRVLQGTRQVASFTRIQLMRAGIDLMNTAYNYLDLTPKGEMKVVADNSRSGATTSTRIEDSGYNPQTIPGQKSAWEKSGPAENSLRADLPEARLSEALRSEGSQAPMSFPKREWRSAASLSGPRVGATLAEKIGDNPRRSGYR
jgi:hypothetical protein